jgi:3-methyladenine DNA glycosylase AlkD
MEIKKYVEQLSEKLDFAGEPERAESMAKYMRNKFDFYGVAAPTRKSIVSEHIADLGYPEYQHWMEMAKIAWNEPREVQYASIDLWMKRKKVISEDAERFLKFIISTHSWWDTVDMIASTLVGSWALLYPEKKSYIEENWLSSPNIWLQRTAIIYQLKYKGETDLRLLENAIEYSANHPDFFIRKAIGWALREYSKVDGQWVKMILKTYPVSNLTRREAVKWMNRQ